MSRPRVSLTVAGIRARSSSRLNASMVSREEPSNSPVGLYGIRLTLNVLASRSAASCRAWSRVSFDAGEHHVLDEHLASSELEVAPALREDFPERIAIVDGHELRAQLRIGCVDGEREPDRLLDLVDEPPQSGHPADRRDGRPPVRDAEVREPSRGFHHGVVVQERLTHAHVHGMVHRLDPAKVQRLVEDLGRASGCGRSASRPSRRTCRSAGSRTARKGRASGVRPGSASRPLRPGARRAYGRAPSSSRRRASRSVTTSSVENGTSSASATRSGFARVVICSYDVEPRAVHSHTCRAR